MATPTALPGKYIDAPNFLSVIPVKFRNSPDKWPSRVGIRTGLPAVIYTRTHPRERREHKYRGELRWGAAIFPSRCTRFSTNQTGTTTSTVRPPKQEEQSPRYPIRVLKKCRPTSRLDVWRVKSLRSLAGVQVLRTKREAGEQRRSQFHSILFASITLNNLGGAWNASPTRALTASFFRSLRFRPITTKLKEKRKKKTRVSKLQSVSNCSYYVVYDELKANTLLRTS